MRSLSLLLFLSFATALSAQETGVDADEFVRILPKSPEQERQHLHIKEGFTMELVASEPQVEDPVAMCFDEFGNLYVAELHDHQHLPDPHTSKVKILSDEDGDGFFETSKVFADGLGWITGIACWDGGIFVGCSPDFIYLKDTDGDSVADVQEVILSGFDETAEGDRMEKYHHERSLNNFNWGPDNRLYCAAGLNGGFVRNIAHPEAVPVTLRKLDFSLDPIARLMRPETGSSQHGMAMDNWGNRYQTTNSNPAIFPSYLLRYRLRNPLASLPPPMATISRPGPKGPVFRRSRPEPWREARTRLRAAGIERGPIEQGGTVSGYFTGTADGAIYRGSAFPPEYAGSLFVGEVSENIIHRKEIHFPADRVEPDGLRPEDESDFEFVASSDNWFRPVQIINGPGGALYVADMYREVVEAWHTIPEYIREHLDRDSGKDRGRIWRLVPETSQGGGRRPSFHDLGIEEIVEVLVSSRGWEQDTAARVLFQNRDKRAVPFLQNKLDSAAMSPPATLRVWYALRSFGALQISDLLTGLESESPWLRIHALRLLEEMSREVSEFYVLPLLPLAEDPDPRVLYQLAFTLGGFFFEETGDAYSRLATRLPDDEWLAKAIAASAGEENLSRLLGEVLSANHGASAIVAAVCRESGRLGIALPSGYPDIKIVKPDAWTASLTSYNDGLRASGKKLSTMKGEAWTSPLKGACHKAIHDVSLPQEMRTKCLRFLPVLGVSEGEIIVEALPFLSPGISNDLQTAGVEVVRLSAKSPDSSKLLLMNFSSIDAHLRSPLIHLMAQRQNLRKPLLDAIRKGKVIRPMEVPAAAAALLRGDSVLGSEAADTLPPPLDRDAVVVSFQAALAMKGNRVRGEATFRARCLVCHQLGEEGGQVGPVMGEFQKHGKGQIMLNLLNPNKTVQPDYVGFVVTTNSGEMIPGRIIEDTSASVVIRDAAGNDRRIAREEVKSLVSTGRTLMPDGLEAGMAPQEMADLLEFIISHR